RPARGLPGVRAAGGTGLSGTAGRLPRATAWAVRRPPGTGARGLPRTGTGAPGTPDLRAARARVPGPRAGPGRVPGVGVRGRVRARPPAVRRVAAVGHRRGAAAGHRGAAPSGAAAVGAGVRQPEGRG